MNKTKSKVLSLILASAMIVSSFSSLNFASAATTRENGRLSVEEDELYLVSNGTADGKITIDDLLGGSPELKTYDNGIASDVEFVSFTHASGDRIVKSIKDNSKEDIDDAVYLAKDAAGKEVITVTYEGEYDRDDKTVKVRGKQDITIYADPVGAQVIGKTGYSKAAGKGTPDDVEVASINDEAVTFSVYEVDEASTDSLNSTYDELTGAAAPVFTVKTASDKAFDLAKNAEIKADASGVYTVPTKYHPAGSSNQAAVDAAQAALDAAKAELALLKEDKTALETAATNAATALTEAQNDLSEAQNAVVTPGSPTEEEQKAIDDAQEKVDDATAAKTAADNKLAAYNAAVDKGETELTKAVTDAQKAYDDAVAEGGALKYASTGTISTQATLKTNADDDEKDTYKFTVAKQWTVNYSGLEINKKGSSTYISEDGTTLDFDNDKWSSEDKPHAYAITGYDIKLAGDVTSLNVNGGKVGNITGTNAATINVDGATTGDIKAAVINIDDGNVGTLKQKTGDNAVAITVDDGKVKAIDADAATVTINGGTISGNVVGDSVAVDSSDDEVSTTINGNVTAKGDDAKVEVGSSSDAAVKITGIVKGAVELSDEFVSVGTVDADYENDLVFDDFTGTVGAIINTTDINIDLLGESLVSVKGTLDAGSINVEDEDAKLTIGGGTINSVSGDGTLAVPAGKLFIEDSMEDVTLQLTEGLVAGATAFQAYSDAVDVEDFTALGFVVEQKAVNDDVDKFVIKSITLAGVQTDKTELSLAKGQESTVTVTAYPTGTAIPAGASIDWDIDGNDDYISLTTEGNVATIKVLDYNTDYATDNQATITATLVDENGDTYDDFVAATVKVTATALPQSTVTLDTTKPVTVGTGAVYQYIAKSSTGAVMSAASSDTQIATVELFNAADARGYKFQVKGVAEGTATITTTDANGATATLTVNVVKVDGTLRADTTTYTFAPGKVYDVKFSTTGTTAVPVVTVNGKVVSIVPRGNGVYRVTAQNPGTAFVVATVGNTHVSVKFVVANGAASVGVKGNNVSTLK